MQTASENPSSAGPDAPLFQERAICYIDLLGFSNAVVSGARSQDQINQLAELLLDAERLVSRYEPAELTFQSLSDSIFISTVSDSAENIKNLVICCQDLYTFFIERGFLARGGIASGPCMISNSIVLGEPVVRAVKLEEQVADYPRIVINKRTMDILKDSDAGEFIEANLVRGEDGPYWINPFVPLFDFALQSDERFKANRGEISDVVFDERQKFIDEINHITDFISKSMYSLQESRRVFSLYYWIFKFYRSRLKVVSERIGSEIRLPEFTA